MFIISECNEYAVAVSSIQCLRVYDADEDSDFELYANVDNVFNSQKESSTPVGYPIFSSEDKQKCIAVRDKLIEQINDRTRTAAIRVADISSQLS